MFQNFYKTTSNLPPGGQSTFSPISFSRLKRIAPALLVTLGSLIVANVAWPILYYQLFVSPSLTRQELVSPINQTETVFFSPTQTTNPSEATTVPAQALGQEVDYTKPQNWFPTAQFADGNTSKITHYKVSIPSVNIQDAVVEIGGNDLSSHLIQYPGTANPGQLGSPVVFGHSVLRQFYSPAITNPNRYMSIFSKIMTLKEGDPIYVNFDGINYTYTVVDKVEVKPEDVFILQQRYDQRELKLITCVPEGTYLRRGVVIARLENVN